MHKSAKTIQWILGVGGICFLGCSSASHLAQLEKQDKEILRLNALVRDADERLEIASKQLQASVDHATSLERSLEATKKAFDELMQQAADDAGRLKKQCDAMERELASTRERLAELSRKDRDAAPAVTLVGTWVLEGDPIYRFLFFANGTGVFQHWDGDAWYAGEPRPFVGGKPPLRSDGQFVFRASGADGAFQLRFIRSRERTEYRHPKPGDYLGKMEAVEKRDEKVIDVAVAMKSPDAARLVGWQTKDAVVKRVDESWTPKDVKE